MRRSGFRLIQAIYNLCLGTWFGAMMMLVFVAIITFATIRQYNPTLPGAFEGSPEMQALAPGMLAGEIVGRVLKVLAIIQGICAVGVTFCLLLQSTVFTRFLRGGAAGWRNVLRVTLACVPVLILLADLALVTPQIYNNRVIMYDPDQPTELRHQAKAEFDRYHELSERTGGLAMLGLLGAMLFSPFAFRTADETEAAAAPSNPAASA